MQGSERGVGHSSGPSSSRLASQHRFNHSHSGTSSGSGSGSGSGTTLMESKIAYLRQMVVRYLSCRDPIVRPHIESALVAILRVTAEEKKAIEDRQKDENPETVNSIYGMTSAVGGIDLSSITSFLGSFSIS